MVGVGYTIGAIRCPPNTGGSYFDGSPSVVEEPFKPTAWHDDEQLYIAFEIAANTASIENTSRSRGRG
ncbi:hypothetical protein GCM10007159_40770 [Modicisalibacter luteus]|nr:hypothetical protein GCM10007159_40770 [Halomonas lutea]